MTRASFRSLLAADGPLILPGAHDALAARLIQRAGFEGYFIGGFGAVGARYGVPDIGLKSLGDISQAVRDILAVCDLPVLVDADDGYGDVKNVVHTVHTYEKMGVGALFLEDQRWPKRCGHLEGKLVVPVEEHEAKIRAAAQERINPDTFLIARTDARAVTGLDDAMRRADPASRGILPARFQDPALRHRPDPARRARHAGRARRHALGEIRTDGHRRHAAGVPVGGRVRGLDSYRRILPRRQGRFRLGTVCCALAGSDVNDRFRRRAQPVSATPPPPKAVIRGVDCSSTRRDRAES